MKSFIIVVLVLIIAGLGIYFLFSSLSPAGVDEDIQKQTDQLQNDEETTETQTGDPNKDSEGNPIIGKSAEGKNITAYQYGNGDTEILFVGGIHGGYEWNTVLLAYETMDYLKANPSVIPANVKVTIVPVLNPDGLNKTVGTPGRFELSAVPKLEADTVAGRFNGNNVDLNRNFDCDWQTNATWQSKAVSGGSAVFSEPESQAIKNYIETNNPTAVVVWYSAAGGVFSSSCHNGVLEETINLTKIYAKASGYPSFEDFNFYEITGDMVNWLAKKKIPAISVLLTNHKDTEWTKNLAGIKALLKNYAK